MTLEEFNKLPLNRKLSFKNDNPNGYRKMFGLGLSTDVPKGYNADGIGTLEDFNKLDLNHQIDFKDSYPAQYTKLFADGGAHLTLSGTANGGVKLSVNPQDIKTPADFEKLSHTDKLAFRDSYRDQYLKLFASDDAHLTPSGTAGGSVKLSVNPQDIKTPADFEKLSYTDKLAFRDSHREEYKKLFG